VVLPEHAASTAADPPNVRDAKRDWLKDTARDERISLLLARHLGLGVSEVVVPFPCVLHAGCEVRLTTGRNGEIVYFDAALEGIKRQFQTIPELAVAIRSGLVRKLRPIGVALWRIRLLHECGLIDLPPATVLDVPTGSPESLRRARDGFELLLRCRWWLDPGVCVPFSRAFASVWCGISTDDAREAIKSLRDSGVIEKVGEASIGSSRPAYLYLPGSTLSATAEARV
jgi:hypothetical protein